MLAVTWVYGLLNEKSYRLHTSYFSLVHPVAEQRSCTKNQLPQSSRTLPSGPAKDLHQLDGHDLLHVSAQVEEPQDPPFSDPPLLSGKETIGSIGSILSFHHPQSSDISFSNTCSAAADATISAMLKDSSPMTPAGHTLPPCPNVHDSSQDGATTLLENPQT